MEQHTKDRVEDSPRDFIDVYLSEMEKQGLSGESSFHSKRKLTLASDQNKIEIWCDPFVPLRIEKQLISVVIDLFIAGAETTSNSIGEII